MAKLMAFSNLRDKVFEWPFTERDTQAAPWDVFDTFIIFFAEEATDGPIASKEQRVQYIINPQELRTHYIAHTLDDYELGKTPEAAAAYPWMMNNCIAWVEERTVYEPTPWEVADV